MAAFAAASQGAGMRTSQPPAGCLIGHNRARESAAGRCAAVLGLPRSSRNKSAAQNGLVIHICSQCGALLLEDAERCSFCDALLVDRDDLTSRDEVHDEEARYDVPEVPALVGVSATAPSERRTERRASPEEPEWRREVARRLHDYRARRRHLYPDDAQSGLPLFDEPALEEPEEALEPPPRARIAPRQRSERVDICIQPELDFSSAAEYGARPQTALVPVATLAERQAAGLLDVLFLVLAFAGFLGLFRSLGGELVVAKVNAIVYLAAFFLFYAQYFFLFTTFAGSTPGMQLRGLTIVRLDGTLPDTRQLLWRSFGYLLSVATLMLGFVWALWDDDRFTWQDRISQTYITAAVPLSDFDSLAVRPGHRFAHK
jgi:uncharacterized RDD family membrane protein YckC